MIAIGNKQSKISLFNALVSFQHARHGICTSFSFSRYLDCLTPVTAFELYQDCEVFFIVTLKYVPLRVGFPSNFDHLFFSIAYTS